MGFFISLPVPRLRGLWQMLGGGSKAGGWPQVVENRLDRDLGIWRMMVDNIDNHSSCEKKSG